MDNVTNRNGVWWMDAPLPPVRHTCSSWTVGKIDGDTVRRCACGAIALDGPGLASLGRPIWLEVNSRRRDSRVRRSPARGGRRRPPRWRGWFRLR